MAAELEDELRPFVDEQGKPEEAFRGVVRRIEEQHERRVRRAEREFLDWLAAGARRLLAGRAWRPASRPGDEVLINIDRPGEIGAPVRSAAGAALAMGAVEDARAQLADETNLNARLVLEGLLLRLSELASAGGLSAPAERPWPPAALWKKWYWHHWRWRSRVGRSNEEGPGGDRSSAHRR